MKLTDFEKRIWRIVIVILCLVGVILNISTFFNWLMKLIGAFNVVILGAILAYIVNLIMVRFEQIFYKLNQSKKTGWIRPLSILVSFLIVAVLIIVLVSLVLPTITEATQVLIQVFPPYFAQIQSFMEEFFRDNPQISQLLSDFNIDINELFTRLSEFVTSTVGGLFNSTLSTMNTIVNSLFNGLLATILAIYMLADKERFIGLYHRIMNLFVPIRKSKKIHHALQIINQTFSSFIVGQCIEAVILGTLCIVGNKILNMPYAVMIGTLVGLINIIPMVGAYIGGAIGVFLVFTVDPIKAIVFFIYLCILQQIESNIIYPRVVGRSVGLPGIYVLMTVIVAGSLYGITGMLIGIPLVASVYKMIRIYIEQKEAELQIGSVPTQDNTEQSKGNEKINTN